MRFRQQDQLRAVTGQVADAGDAGGQVGGAIITTGLLDQADGQVFCGHGSSLAAKLESGPAGCIIHDVLI